MGGPSSRYLTGKGPFKKLNQLKILIQPMCFTYVT